MRRPRIVGAALGLLGMTAAAGCSPPPPVDPNVIIVGIPSSPANLDPRLGVDAASQRLHQLLYDNLLEKDDALRVGPGLATGWEMPDPLTYVVRLRQGVRFHDGHELTSRDVVYTFSAFLDPDFVSGRKGAYTLLDSVRAVGRDTVEFTLKEPFASFPVNLIMPIVPDGSGPELREHPIGTGPYRFVSQTPDDEIVLTAFPEYFGGPPANAGIVLKVVPDDIMRGLELRKGTVDLVVNELPPDMMFELARDEHLQLTTSPGTDYMYLGVNVRDPVLRDVRVRRAISYAVDRNSIVKYLRRDLATPAVGVLPPQTWAFADDVMRFPHDPDRAGRLLDEAGYPDPDGDGPLARLTLTLKVSSFEQYRLQAVVIQQNLKDVGIDLDVRTYEFATLFADVLQGAFQLVSMQWVGVSDPDMLRRVFHSTQIPPVGFNRGFYDNPDVDRLIDAATVSTDEEERGRLYAEAQRLIAADVPYISLWYRTNAVVSKRDLANINPPPGADYVFLKDVRRIVE
jgi:peptide/nickel transport system substrate-binding protein